VCVLPGTHMAHSVLSQGNPQSFHTVDLMVIFLAKTCFIESLDTSF
jgi:hypothetical protein